MNLNEKQIKDIILEFLKNNFVIDDNTSSIDETLSLYENGIVDSTGILELVDFLEERFEIIVEDDELIPDNLDSIEKIAKFVMRKKSNASK